MPILSVWLVLDGRLWASAISIARLEFKLQIYFENMLDSLVKIIIEQNIYVNKMYKDKL